MWLTGDLVVIQTHSQIADLTLALISQKTSHKQNNLLKPKRILHLPHLPWYLSENDVTSLANKLNITHFIPLHHHQTIHRIFNALFIRDVRIV